ncbi:glycosyltransferase [Microbacterium esteraromaticum]|uniref:glycosyltransferase n=1 Tax=Microbacterium esteraromaticum TaxID=57043 RepID=UPI0023689E04|nr:glycosyltransferase [Microbacterium esteraromaticum]WDH79818.1 glycosyltransferase [Microbacterium esteraromaticum]
MTKASILIPPTYFAVSHARLLGAAHDVRIFAGAARVTDPHALDGIELDETLPQVLPFTDRWPIRRREQVGALLWGATSRRIRRWAPDVIHQHFAYGARAAVSAAKRARRPLAVTVHGGDAFVPLTPLRERGLRARPALFAMQREVRAVYRRADLILAVSEYIAGIAVQGGADPARVRVHYQGIDTDVFTPPEEPMTASVRRVLFVGRLVDAKGVFDLLEASAALVEEQPHELVFVGDGPARTRLESAAQASPHIRVAGSLPSSEVRDLLRTAHALVLPTRLNGRAREAAGLVLLEAQACGVPVIAYDSGGTAEMMNVGETGWLAPEGDVESLQARLSESLSQTASSRADMGRRARAFVVEHRSLTASARQLSAIYEEIRR